MEQLLTMFPESWGSWITFSVMVLAALATALPAPAEESNVVYKFVYKIINLVAFNVGKAKNADEVK